MSKTRLALFYRIFSFGLRGKSRSNRQHEHNNLKTKPLTFCKFEF